jgi:hypothetical protein
MYPAGKKKSMSQRIQHQAVHVNSTDSNGEVEVDFEFDFETVVASVSEPHTGTPTAISCTVRKTAAATCKVKVYKQDTAPMANHSCDLQLIAVSG